MVKGLPPEVRTEILGTGIVYIAEKYAPRFSAFWESKVNGRQVMVEVGPGWDSLEEAIAWGRARAPELHIQADADEGVPQRVVSNPLMEDDSAVTTWVYLTMLEEISFETRTELRGSGIVYVTEESRPDHKRFFGHWESKLDKRPVFVEQGPGWDDVEEAIAWGRARALKVLVHLESPERSGFYSAGEDGPATISKLDGDPEILLWPPKQV